MFLLNNFLPEVIMFIIVLQIQIFIQNFISYSHQLLVCYLEDRIFFYIFYLMSFFVIAKVYLSLLHFY